MCVFLRLGIHCEFKKGTVPECTLDCNNGGECMVGINNADEVHDLAHFYDNAEEFMHCKCPEGWGGALCEVARQECGSHHCYNGGTCLQHTDSDGQTKHRCDCTTANGDDYSYAGRFCQYQSTSFCTKKEDENGQLFCVNGGTCKQGS